MSSSTTTASSSMTKISSSNNNDNNDNDDAVSSSARIRQRKQELRKLIRSRMKSTYPTSNETKSSVLLLNSTSLLGIQSDLVFHRLFQLQQYTTANSIGIFLSMPGGEIQTSSAIARMIQDKKSLYVPRVGLDFDNPDMDMIRCDEYIQTSLSSKLHDNDDDNKSKKKMFYDGWPRNKWDIPEPPLPIQDDDDDNASPLLVVAKQGDIDILIVPGCAFDKAGRRLGHGKGYYDRFIAKIRIEYDDNNTITTGSNNDTNVSSTSGDDNEKDGPAVTTKTKKKKPLLVGVCLEEQYLQQLPYGIATNWKEEDSADQRNNNNNDGIIPITDHDCFMDVILTPSKTILLRNFQVLSFNH
jgi:5-formyltetrahydrofolate cyclo-ligase